MKIKDTYYRSIWTEGEESQAFVVIDQRRLPHHLDIEEIRTTEEVFYCIQEMHVRGAPLIGATAAYGMWLASLEAEQQALDAVAHLEFLKERAAYLEQSRPTAINLLWALRRQMQIAAGIDLEERSTALFKEAGIIADEDVQVNSSIGEFGLKLIEEIAAGKAEGEPVRILTHCNAGWLATVDWGTATAPMYKAHEKGLSLEIWVDETRPRNQGARITAFELGQHGISHQVIADNTGGHLMQQGLVDLVLVGTDRTTRGGDVCNKIGTYLKALAANDNQVPFYVCLPSSTIDWEILSGSEIPIEQRNADEVRRIAGMTRDGMQEVLLCPSDSSAINYAFDVTPARLVSGLITELGICEASEEGLLGLFPEKKNID
jgi:methylthioribose-1-phosphate isomerase